MNQAVLQDDYPRLRRAILRVIEAAKAESLAFNDATAAYSGDAMTALRETHLDELDAVQALAASLELFDRRLTRVEGRAWGVSDDDDVARVG